MVEDMGGFTIKEIVIEIRRDVKDLGEKIDRIDRSGSIGTREDLADHETRIRHLEEDNNETQGIDSFKRWLLPTLVSALSTAALVVSLIH